MADPTQHDRFWSKVDRRSWSECWNWTGATTQGYGRFFLGGSPRYAYAHRVAFRLTYGHWPTVARHSCDNPRCCNPAHILDGTHADNRRDSVSRGRHQHGETHYCAKIDAAAVVEIRRRRALGEPLKSIGDDYGVTVAHVHNICARRTWKHVP